LLLLTNLTTQHAARVVSDIQERKKYGFAKRYFNRETHEKHEKNNENQ